MLQLDRCRIADFLNDLLFSYSMLKRDGMYISFVHRSFQEFFCALFVSGTSSAELGEAFDELVERESRDNCVKMLCDLAPDKVLFGWAKPFLKRQIDRCQRMATEQAPANFARELYGTLRICPDKMLYAAGATPMLAKLLLYCQIAEDAEGHALLEKRSGNIDTKRREAFFGERRPFDYKEFEPTGEDDVWLRQSWIDKQLHGLLKHLRHALEWIEEIEERRSEKIKISFAAPEKAKPPTNRVEFTVRGKPLEIRDRKTGETKQVPQDVVTYRRVPELKPGGER